MREVKSATTADYQTLMRVEVLSQDHAQAVAGTLIGRGGRRIVEVEGIEVEAELGPHMLYFTNEDKPGLIGAVATVLGEAGVNIATFSLGRREPGGAAVGLIGVDSAVADDVLAKLHARAPLIDLKRLSF